MSNFKRGDKLICVNTYGITHLSKGSIYTVSYVREGYVHVVEVDIHFSYRLDRFELVSRGYPNEPHKHAELIKAWADGAEIEYLDNINGKWFIATTPRWFTDWQYRIKPTTYTITIDGKDIEISDESYQAFVEQFQK